MNTKKVANRFGVGITTVKRWLNQGLFPNARIERGKWYIPPEDVEDFVRPNIKPGAPRKSIEQRVRKVGMYFLIPLEIRDKLDGVENKSRFVSEAIVEKIERDGLT